MCNSNVHQDQALIEVLAAIHHNLVTAASDIDMVLYTRQLDAPVQAPLHNTVGWIDRARDELRDALVRLPKVEQ